MRIPKREIVRFVLLEILQSQRVSSQEELTKILKEKLRRVDRSYSITGRRARMIALKTPNIHVRILTRKGGRNNKPKKCPSCEHSLKKVYAKNLKGRKFLVKLTCPRCGYQASADRWLPRRYEFELRK